MVSLAAERAACRAAQRVTQVYFQTDRFQEAPPAARRPALWDTLFRDLSISDALSYKKILVFILSAFDFRRPTQKVRND